MNQNSNKWMGKARFVLGCLICIGILILIIGINVNLRKNRTYIPINNDDPIIYKTPNPEPNPTQKYFEDAHYNPTPTPELRNQVLQKMREKAKDEWPTDYNMQEYLIKMQMEAYDYMVTKPDSPIKRKAIDEWPNDYNMQKYVYKIQMDAKERLGY